MTVAFIKLHVAGNDYILIDEDRRGHEFLQNGNSPRSLIATLILDRRTGVGASACVYIHRSSGPGSQEQRIFARAYQSDGAEKALAPDSLLCIARYCFDLAYHTDGYISIETGYPQADTYRLEIIDSRSFLITLPYPDMQPLTLLIDGQTAYAYQIRFFQHQYTVALAFSTTFSETGTHYKAGPGPKRIRQALLAMQKHPAGSEQSQPASIPLVVRCIGKDTVRYLGPEPTDRIEGAAAAVLAAGFHGFIVHSYQTQGNQPVLAEWRGRGGAVSYASFPSFTTNATSLSSTTLIDRGRFYVTADRQRDRLTIVGKAEYCFDGNFDV
ncbi:MAG: hypothetical protein SNJ56_03240 [Termitinemataceae bacterium]